jgi:transposase
MSGYNQEKGFMVVAETRRTWTDAEKKVILAETVERSVSSVARKHGVASSLVFRWRREVGMAGKKKAARKTPEAFLPVVVHPHRLLQFLYQRQVLLAA